MLDLGTQGIIQVVERRKVSFNPKGLSLFLKEKIEL